MKYRKLKCNTCGNDFNHPFQPGRPPKNCQSCSGVLKMQAMDKQITMVNFQCRGCQKVVNEARSRGSKPQVNCKECREKPKVAIRATNAPEVKTTKFQARICSDCEKPFSFQVKRGKKPTRCVPCRENVVIIANKERVATELECIICESMFPRPIKRGKPNPVCPTCLNKAGKITEEEKNTLLQPRYTGEALAEYLDNKLRALGLHFSQHEDRRWA